MALVTIRRSSSVQTPKKTDEEDKTSENPEDEIGTCVSKSLNECYFANKGAALVLGEVERDCERRAPARTQPDIQHHLQSMFLLLRPEETLKMAVKLESAHAGRTRYLVVVCQRDEAALLGIDCNERTTVGLVLRVLADTSIKLDGDGGFSVCVCSQQHIFKPVSVQAMWSALQTLHRASGRARELNHFAAGMSHSWCEYYEDRVTSDRSCLNEWHAMDCIESRRPPSPDSLRLKPRERDETERVIRCTLKEIMMSVDLDEVTSKVIRVRLEDELDMDLAEYKSFIDQEMLTILGQMDAPTEIFDHVYLGSEWNASNLEELQRNGVRHILNVTREIDNFFPGLFDYLNIRVYDDDKTDLLKHWDNTFKYINRARNEGSKVLVHCKMGISRSASVVIAYAMKAYNWNFDKALKHVKAKRGCIKPNTNFLSQLETYQGILDAMKNKEKLQRSKSETNLKAPITTSKTEKVSEDPAPLLLLEALSCSGGGGTRRPRSWSPDTKLAASLLPPTSVSLESLAAETRHMLMPCAGGSYSVSPNQIIRLKEEGAPSVKHIVNEIENASADRARRYHRLNFGGQPEPPRPPDPVTPQPTLSPLRAAAPDFPSGEAERIQPWDPGEILHIDAVPDENDSDDLVKSKSAVVDAKTKQSDSLPSVLEEVTARPVAEFSDKNCRPLEFLRHPPLGVDDSPLPAVGLGAIGEKPIPDISDNERKFNETCAILKELASAAARIERARERGASTWSGRASSGVGQAWAHGGLRRRRPVCASHPDLPRAAVASPHGRVSNLKKEFEARSEGTVRNLVGRYDRGGRARSESAGEASRGRAPDAPKKCRLAEGPALRNSFCGVRPVGERQPPVPTVLAMAPLDYSDVLVSTVMSKAQNKKQLQHGKTHPLTRLSLNRSTNRCSNPVYNTM